MRQHPEIREAVVVLDEREEDKRLVGYFVPGTSAPSTAELRDFLGGKLPDYMVPSAFVVLDAVPLTPNGKLDRRALQALYKENIAATVSYTAPRTEIEKKLAQIWQEMLGVERVGIGENFFDLGGDSVSAMRAVVRMEKELELDLSVSCLFNNPTIELLAVALGEMKASAHGEEDLLRMLDEIDAMPASNAERK
jgi:acyl carrier protein